MRMQKELVILKKFQMLSSIITINTGGVTAAFIINTIRYKKTGLCWLCTAKQLATQTAQGKSSQTMLRDKITMLKTIYGKQYM